MSQRELARLADISPAYPGILERSAKEPEVSGAIAVRICRVFGCSVPYLIEGEGEPPTEVEVREAVARARPAAPVDGPAEAPVEPAPEPQDAA